MRASHDQIAKISAQFGDYATLKELEWTNNKLKDYYTVKSA